MSTSGKAALNIPIYDLVIIIGVMIMFSFQVSAQETLVEKENQYYQIVDVPIPDSVKLEVGGLAFNDQNQLGVATRRGEIWLIDQPTSRHPSYSLFMSGLHEPLWLAWHNQAFYTTERGRLNKISDSNQDGQADRLETIYAWPLSGNYHEYSYGPLFLENGDMMVTLNLGWEGRGKSLSKWRGWMVKITPDGTLEPYATGLRSPAAFCELANGDIFYAENQGDWIGSGRITHLEKGDFAGHPAGLRWTQQEHSPLKLKPEIFPDSIGLLYDFSQNIASFKVPTVWLPHTIMGISTSALLPIETGQFGPFEGQLLVGDQGHSKIMRVALEKVNGVYQGACFPFHEGFSSGILRMIWGNDQSVFVGMTSRGWSSTGKEEFGLQRLVWTGKNPFEMKSVKVTDDGFELEFTQPVDKATARMPENYHLTGFTYSYHKDYGSPVINQRACQVEKVAISEDKRTVRLTVNGLRLGYIHEIRLSGIKSSNSQTLLHDVAYYTLNEFPQGMHEHQDMPLARTESENPTDGCGDDPKKNMTVQPTDWANGPDVEIVIGTEPGLKFDLSSFQVPAGSKVKLVFNNSDDMLHNLVITKPQKGEEVGKAAMGLGLQGASLGYVPSSSSVLFHTCILQPESSQEIYFTAPDQPGVYDYVCTFPGHYLSMKGKMIVTSTETSSATE